MPTENVTQNGVVPSDDADTESDELSDEKDIVFSGLNNDPAFLAEMERYRRREKFMVAIVSPLGRIPLIGRLVSGFWYCVMDEGVRSTCKPRWGAITFSFLNDGFSPTPWHTWQQLTNYNGPYSGIWPDGAPHNQAEAQERLRTYSSKERSDSNRQCDPD
jgi:hypothetical protein